MKILHEQLTVANNPIGWHEMDLENGIILFSWYNGKPDAVARVITHHGLDGMHYCIYEYDNFTKTYSKPISEHKTIRDAINETMRLYPIEIKMENFKL